MSGRIVTISRKSRQCNLGKKKKSILIIVKENQLLHSDNLIRLNSWYFLNPTKTYAREKTLELQFAFQAAKNRGDNYHRVERGCFLAQCFDRQRNKEKILQNNLLSSW